MTRIRDDYVFGTTTAPLAPGDTTLSSTGLSRLVDVTGSDYAAVILHDPVALVYEVVYVTAHSYGSSTATISRAQEGTSARSWAVNTAWLHGLTTGDFTDLDARYAPYAAVLRPNLHVGPEDPGFTQPGLWVQTGLGDDGTGITFWIEDGT